jgi:hypothetical protein
MSAAVVSVDDGCDVCGRAGVAGVMWRRRFRDDFNAGRVAVLCLDCVMEGAAALAAHGNAIFGAPSEPSGGES